MLLPKIIYVEGYEVRVSLYFESKLAETKLIYRVMHACVEFKLKISPRLKCQLVRNIFPAF